MLCCVYVGWEEVVGSFFGETDLLLELRKRWKMRICHMLRERNEIQCPEFNFFVGCT